jgi:hypothetical protein
MPVSSKKFSGFWKINVAEIPVGYRKFFAPPSPVQAN